MKISVQSIKYTYLKLKMVLHPFLKMCVRFIFGIDVFICLLALALFIYQFGFNVPEHQMLFAKSVYYLTFLFLVVRQTISIIQSLINRKQPTRNKLKEFLYYSIVLLVFLAHWVFPESWMSDVIFRTLSHEYILYVLAAIHVIVTLSQSVISWLNTYLNPYWLFVGSFLFLIFAGAGLLMLPNATHEPITFFQSLFTSVSAVCVTGLVVVDTATTFSPVGKAILLFLIQAGGIGIMTFTSFFGFYSQARHSVQSQLTIRNMLNDEEGFGQLLNSLRNVVFVTFLVEIIGAVFLLLSKDIYTWKTVAESFFHSVSAFCNAGFSIYSNGFMNEAIHNNIGYLFSASLLILIGGLGFPIIFNLINWLKYRLAILFRRVFRKQQTFKHIPRILNTNSVIVLITSAALLVFGTVFFYISEYNNALAALTQLEKISTAFFMAVTPRTAGFNSFDMSSLFPVSLLFMIPLMWIGASPMSTGGGIKTTTFGIALINVWNTIRGREKNEVRYRQISPSTVNRAFVIIFVSIVLLMICVLLMRIFEPHVAIEHIVFECVSALSTVGLSVDLTPTLTPQSHALLIVLMFTGRIGFITLLSCFIKPKTFHNYQYPHEVIAIN